VTWAHRRLLGGRRATGQLDSRLQRAVAAVAAAVAAAAVAAAAVAAAAVAAAAVAAAAVAAAAVAAAVLAAAVLAAAALAAAGVVAAVAVLAVLAVAAAAAVAETLAPGGARAARRRRRVPDQVVMALRLHQRALEGSCSAHGLCWRRRAGRSFAPVHSFNVTQPHVSCVFPSSVSFCSVVAVGRRPCLRTRATSHPFMTPEARKSSVKDSGFIV
jgi:hypothetical protein